ncbi:serine/threonine-protein kinase ATR [Condylostylus longicornis]|uniref:serine/threonine-protein kinase ATR n=1 Tax=Condylostylus longicornis TaxID=2530218 RepID=UPI00244DF8A1|nr:serine/threonine-protein kinase ATR [Condylostylus longicornis]
MSERKLRVEMWKTMLNLVSSSIENNQIDQIISVARENLIYDDPGLLSESLDDSDAIQLEETFNMWLMNQILYSESISQSQSAIEELIDFQAEFLVGCFRKKRALFSKFVNIYISFTKNLLNLYGTRKFPEIFEIFYTNDAENIQKFEPQALYYKIEFKENELESNMRKIETLLGSNIKIFQNLMPLSTMWFTIENMQVMRNVLEAFDICSWNIKIIYQMRGFSKLILKIPLALEIDCIEHRQAEILLINTLNYFKETQAYVKEKKLNKDHVKMEKLILIIGNILNILLSKSFNNILPEIVKDLYKVLINILEEILLINYDLCFNESQVEELITLAKNHSEFFLTFTSLVLKDIRSSQQDKINLNEISQNWIKVEIITEENVCNTTFVNIINHCDFSKSSRILNNWTYFLPKICILTLQYEKDVKDELLLRYIGDLLNMLTKYALCNGLPEKQIYYVIKLCIMFLIRYESHVPYLAIELAHNVCSENNITTNNILNWYQREILQLIANLCNAIYLCHGIRLTKSLEYVSYLFGYKGSREFILRHQDLFITMILPQVIINEECEKLLEEAALYAKITVQDLLKSAFLTFYLEHFIREKSNYFKGCLDYIMKKTNSDFFSLISPENKKTVAKMLIYYHRNPKVVMETFRCLILKEGNPNSISSQSTLTQGNVADITNFLAEGFLGVLNYFEMYLMGCDFQKDLKPEILLSLGEIMRFLGTKYVTQFHFKILAMLSTTLTLKDPYLRKICIEIWKIFINNVDVATLGPSLSRIVASLEPLLNTNQEQINSIYNFLIIENGNLLSTYIADLFFISKLNVSQNIRLFVTQRTEKKLRTNNLQDKIEFYLKQVTHENVIIRVYGLKYLKEVFSENRRELNKMILGQNFINPILENVLGNLMVGCKHSDSNLKLISSKCIGELGAIEPGLMRPNYSAQERIFPLSIHSDAFAIMALKELCKAYQFQKDTHYVDNFSLGIQEILRTFGVCPKRKNKMEVWNAIPERMRQIMEPLLTSCYTGMQKVENAQTHPIFGSECAKTYILWAFSWATNIVHSIEDMDTKHLLNSLLPSLRRDINILDAFLPYVILHGLQNRNQQNRDHIFEELNCVFKNVLNKQPINTSLKTKNREDFIELVASLTKTSKKSQEHEENHLNMENIGRKCAKIGFDLLDFLERWMREYYSVYSNKTESNYIAVKDFINSFDKFELAQVNFECGEYARALKYCEWYLKKTCTQNYNKILQEILSFLIKIYVELMDTDSLEGCMYLKQSEPSLQEQILVNSMTDKLQETAACYEQLIKEKEGANELDALNSTDWDGLVECFLRLDTPETALLISQGVMKKLSTKLNNDCLKESQIEPLWRLGRFEELEELLQHPLFDDSKSWNVLYGKALLLFHKDDVTLDTFEKNIDDIRHSVLKIMKFGAADCDSYHKGYSQVIKLHLLTDIEKCRYLIDRILNIPYEHESIPILTTFFDEWNARLGFLQPTIKVTEPFLCLRRILLNEVKHKLKTNQNYSIFEELINNEIGKLWIRSVQLNREARCYQQAHLNILNAAKYNPDNLFIEQAKLFWMKNDQPNSFKVIEDKILEIEKSGIDSLPVDKRLLYAEAKFLQASYNAESMNINPDLNKKYFNESIKNNNKSEKCYVALAEYHDKIFATLEESVQQSEYGQRTLLSILYNYSKSLQYGCEFLYQSMPRMLSIWFDINDINNGGVYRIQGNSSQATNPYLKKINELMDQSAQVLPLFLYFTAFSQIISRICHPSEAVWKTIKNIVVRLIEKYAQHSLWMILPVFKSSLPSRIRRCHDIFNDKRLRNIQMQKLIKDFNSFAEKFIEFTNFPIERGQTPTVSSLVPLLPKIFRERDFSLVMIPFEKFLQMSLPSLGQRNCSLNSFNPFPNDLVYIYGIREEIVILNSLQRPKRTVLIGSDGKEYTVLLKPNDDLRKDFRLMEFNNIVKQYLYQDAKARQRRLGIRTYAVMPLNEECGIIEWVNDLKPFRQILIELYKSRKISIMSVRELKKFGEKENDIQKRRERFLKELLPRHPPIFYEWFLERFSNPHNWYQARTTFIQSTAVMSIVGYILGLGDRHGENILMDGQTGDAVHVDFNCLFNRAELFAFPEKVPFRLTHNMVDAMGPLGTEGPFKKCCEITMHVLKANTPILMSVLKPFIYDPLVSWNKKSMKTDRNLERTDDGAIINVQRTEARLKGLVNHETVGANMPLSCEGVVNYVIQKAVDIDNLAAMYVGWGPYL